MNKNLKVCVTCGVACAAVCLGLSVGGPETISDEPRTMIEYNDAYVEDLYLQDFNMVKVDVPVVSSPMEEEVVEEPSLPITDEELELLALVTMAEAEDQTELGQRLVIDVILNRVDNSRFADTIYDVIYAPNQFAVMWNGRAEYCMGRVPDSIRELVAEEVMSRTNTEVLYFRMNHYHTFGTPLFVEDDHYFSK